MMRVQVTCPVCKRRIGKTRNLIPPVRIPEHTNGLRYCKGRGMVCVEHKAMEQPKKPKPRLRSFSECEAALEADIRRWRQDRAEERKREPRTTFSVG